MHFLQIWTSTLAMIALSSAQIEPAPIGQNGAAVVVNDCNFTVFYKSVSSQPAPLSSIQPGWFYKETFKLNMSPNGTLGGVSIKLSSNQSIAEAADNSNAFDSSTITQFEYTYNPHTAPGLWYDISNVNGYQGRANESWPFSMYGGLIVEGTSSSCPTITCPPGRVCSEAYTNWNDNWATHSCQNNNSLILTLCSTTGNQRVLEETKDSVNGTGTLASNVSRPSTRHCSSR